jgi:hypothetical protein
MEWQNEESGRGSRPAGGDHAVIWPPALVQRGGPPLPLPLPLLVLVVVGVWYGFGDDCAYGGGGAQEVGLGGEAGYVVGGPERVGVGGARGVGEVDHLQGRRGERGIVGMEGKGGDGVFTV